MKISLSIVASALVLAGCAANPGTAQNDAESTASTASVASSTAAASATPATSAAAAAPCTPASAQASAATAKAKTTKKKTGTTKSASAAPAATPCPAPEAGTAAAPAKEAPATAASAGNRKQVKGINGWTGYILGKPVANSKFNKLKIGMGQKEVTDIAGAPTDQSMHVTGKAWIPFYVGSGKQEVWFYYKGVGRLVFADNAGYTTDTGLIGIEHDAGERGYK